MADYELWLADDAGNRITLIESWNKIEYTITWTPGRWGIVKVDLDGADPAWLQPDRLLYVYRRPEGGSLALEQAGFLRRWRWQDNGAGDLTLTMWGAGPNELLSRRIVAFYAGSSEAEKTDQADDMAKAVVSENLLADSDYSGLVGSRNMLTARFSVDGDLADGPSITKGFAWQYVHKVLAKIADASRANGTPLYYRVVPVAEGEFEFRTYTTRPGRDRRWPDGNNPLLFGVEVGNVANASYEVDYAAEENYIYAGGQGEGSDREVATASDSDRQSKSAWNRREGFASAGNQQSGGTTAAANERLAGGRPRARFRGDFLSTPETPYGGINGWQAGDEVTAIVRDDIHVDCIIEAVHVTVEAGQQDDVRGRAEVSL